MLQMRDFLRREWLNKQHRMCEIPQAADWERHNAAVIMEIHMFGCIISERPT